MSVALLI